MACGCCAKMCFGEISIVCFGGFRSLVGFGLQRIFPPGMQW